MNGKEQVFYIILILRNRRALQSSHSQIFIYKANSAHLSMKRDKQTLSEAWLMVMTRRDMKDARQSNMETEARHFTWNRQILRAGVNNSFLLHSPSFRRTWKQYHCSYALLCHRGEPASAFCTNPLTLTQRGLVTVQHPVFNMLSMYHSPKWVGDNSVLQRNSSEDKKRKSNKKEKQKLPCSWEENS